MYYYLTPLKLWVFIYSGNNTEGIMRFNLAIEGCG